MTQEQVQNVECLVREYKADPNCRPLLWIQCEHVSEAELKLFLYLVKN